MDALPSAERNLSISAYDAGDQQGVVSLLLSTQRKEFGVPITLADQPDLQEIPSFYQTGLGGFRDALRGGRLPQGARDQRRHDAR